jgi:O-antigen/teichoic acid export membrane protein
MGIKPAFSKAHFFKSKGLIGFTFINKISYQIANQADAFVVGVLLGVETTPIYVLTKRSWDLVRLFLNRIGVAFLPGLSHLHGSGDLNKFKLISNRLFHYFGLLTILAACSCATFNKSFVYIWVGPELYAGRLFDIFMGCYVLISMMISVIYYVLYSTGNIKKPSFIGAVQNIIRILLLFVLGWTYGIQGMVLSFSVAAALVCPFYIAQWNLLMTRSISMRLSNCIELLYPLIASIIISTFSSLLFSASNWTWFLIEITLFMIILMAIYCLIDKPFRSFLKTRTSLKKFIYF